MGTSELYVKPQHGYSGGEGIHLRHVAEGIKKNEKAVASSFLGQLGLKYQ